MGGKTKTLAQRFAARVDMSGGPFACWPRTHPDKMMHYKGRQTLSIRRVAWLMARGELPAWTQHVEVLCGNALCCNPKHLACPTLAERVWWYVFKDEPGECWGWQSTRDRRGYGQFKVGGRKGMSVPAHRFIWEQLHGPINDPKLYVCHHCDNPPCCNPAHLFLGTPTENTHDMIRKGRHSHGPKHSALMRSVRERERMNGSYLSEGEGNG